MAVLFLQSKILLSVVGLQNTATVVGAVATHTVKGPTIITVNLDNLQPVFYILETSEMSIKHDDQTNPYSVLNGHLYKVRMKSLIILLALVVMSLSQEDEDKRNPALEAVGTAAVGAGVLGGLLFGGAVLAKAIGDAANDDDRSRSNGGNIVRHHIAHISNSNNDDKCIYNCDGWPYEQCQMSSRGASATCINPYTSRSSSQIFSNYPKCSYRMPEV